MLKRTGLCLFLGVVGAAPACGSPSENNFGGPTAAGSATMGGSSGDSGTAGKGGTSTATGGSAMGGSATGGSGGSTGGTDTGGSATQGGSGGDATTGGTGMATGGTDPGTGGTGMATGGTDPGTGGADPGTGGTMAAGMGGMGMGGKGGRGGKGGSAGKPNCDELAMQYDTALAAARACNAKSGKEQCTDTASSSLTCGCDVPVNPDNADAIAELTRLRKAGASCSMVCPAIACIAPGPGECAADSASPGLCQASGALLQ